MKTFALLLLLIAPTLLADATPDGASLYKSNCVVCHGPDGKGQTPAGKSLKIRDLGSAEVQKQSDAELAAIIAGGKGKMPAYQGKLGAEEIKAVVGFVRTLSPRERVAR